MFCLACRLFKPAVEFFRGDRYMGRCSDCEKTNAPVPEGVRLPDEDKNMFCRYCREEKPLSAFYRGEQYRNRCKECIKAGKTLSPKNMLPTNRASLRGVFKGPGYL